MSIFMIKTKQIILYGTTRCADCRRAKHWLHEHNITFSDINIEENEKAVEKVLKFNDGMQTVPTIVFPDGSILTEPTNNELEQKVLSLGLISM